MIQALTILLARAKRNKRPLLLCEVSCVEQIIASLKAAEEKKSAICLTLAASTSHQLSSLEVLLPLAVALASKSSQAVALEVRLSSLLTSDLTRFRQYSQLAICIPSSVAPEDTQHDFLATCASLAAASTALPTFQALRVPAELSRLGLADMLRQVKRPVILEEAHFSPARLKEIVRSGVAGISLANQLDASFTAGIRAALRNREVFEPTTYLSRGQIAVADRVKNYLQYLET